MISHRCGSWIPLRRIANRLRRGTPQGTLGLRGAYRVRRRASDKTVTAPLTVKMDPRVKTTPAGLQAMFKIESQLAAVLNDSAKADLEAHSAREQIEKLTK